MTTHEIELKVLMLTSLDGDAASHRVLLERLSRRLRAYYKGKLSGMGRGASEAEDLVQDATVGNPYQATYLQSSGAADTVGARNRALQLDRLSASDSPVAG